FIQNATSIPHKHNKEFQLRRYNKNSVKLNYDKHEKPFQEYIKDDSSALSSESRRLFDWIKNVLNRNATIATKNHKLPSYEEALNERIRFRKIETNLTETLTKLSDVLTQILNIVKYTRYHHFDDIRELLHAKHEAKNVITERFKRDLNCSSIKSTELDNVAKTPSNTTKKDTGKSNNVTHNFVEPDDLNKQDNITKIETNNNMPIKYENKSMGNLNNSHSNLKTQDNLTNVNDFATTKIDSNQLNINKNSTKKNKFHNSTSHLYNRNVQETRVKRDTAQVNKIVSKTTAESENTTVEVKKDNSSVTVESDSTTEADIAISGRRSMISIKPTNDEVKNHLFRYINEAFSDITKKIDSLKQIKQMFYNDIRYQIGYIISSIDTLQVNMGNMKRDMNKNKYVWDDKKILNLYDTVKISNNAVTDLLEILKSYVERSLN
ncbi:jg26350, partial [Pararge aegeria aegeria]